MATKKKVFVGSLFEITQLGADEIIRNFKDSHDDPESAPFVVFDQSTQTFSAEVGPDDKEAMFNLLTLISGYIEYHLAHQPGFDEEPRIRPMEGTVLEDFIRDDRSRDNGLLEYQSDDDSDGQDALEGLQHLITYWKPQCGDISILPPVYVDEIKRLTGAELFAEVAEKRYRLMQGDFRLALAKLVRLEPLLEMLKQQQSNQSLLANKSLLVWPPNEKDARIEFVSLRPPHPSYSRVIVNKMEQTLFRKVIGEIRPRTISGEWNEIPGNFHHDGISATNQVQASKIWDGYKFQTFGDPKNMEPIVSSDPASNANSNEPPQLQDSSEARIAAWTSRVVSGADPEIAPEAPVEPVQPSRRRVIIDSDSDDDEPTASAAGPQALGGLMAPTPPRRGATRDEILENATLVSLVSSRPPRSKEQHLTNSTTHDESVGDDLLEDDGKSFMSDSTGLGTDKFPVLPHSPMEFQPHTYNSQPPAIDSIGLENLTFKDNIAGSSLHETIPSLHPDPTPTGSRPSVSPETLLAWLGKEVAPSSPVMPSPSRTTTATDLQDGVSMPSAQQSPDPAADGQRHTTAHLQYSHAGLRRGNNAQYINNNRGVRSHMEHNTEDETASRQEFQPVTGLRRGARGVRASPQRGRASTGRGSRRSSASSHERSLPDTTTHVNSSAPRVPPGFENHVPPYGSNGPGHAHNQTAKTRGGPAQSISPVHYSPGSSISLSAVSAGSRIRFSDVGADYRATDIPKRDQAQLREHSLRAALEAVAAQRQQQNAGNRKARDDKAPPVHSTMQQQGKNPGNKAIKQETKAQKKERLDKAMLEAYGSAPQKQPTKPVAQPEQMSKRKKEQVLKNPIMAEAHPEVAIDKTRGGQCDKLISLLEPLFETGRAFSGRLGFEIAFGQVLILREPQLSEVPLHDVAGWSQLFDPEVGPPQNASTFTKILTTNGADVDRALELKGPAGSSNIKLWSTQRDMNLVSYEFACQNRSNEDFLIVVDQSGKHELRKGLVTVGMINMHVPAQIWDASAAVSGHLNWPDPPESLAKSATAFVNSLYIVPDKERLMIFFRQPTDHEIKVRNLIVKRVSYHQCNLPGCEDIQLKVTEAKSLSTKVHPEDKNLWHGHEPASKDYRQTAEDSRIHYELSLVDVSINRALTQNETLEIGEVTDAATTGKSLLKRTTIRHLLDVAIHMVSKMDFIGMNNFGTLPRLNAEHQERARNLQASLSPKGRTILQIPTLITSPSANRHHAATGASVSHKQQSGAGAGDASRLTAMNMPVHGVRMNTVAEIVEAPDGTRYARGMGGAKIPVAQDLGWTSDTVEPDDSASQIGGPGLVGRTNVASPLLGTRNSNRRAGFW